MEVDHILIGGGLAGSTLALELHKRGKRLAIFDQYAENSSSRVAAGLVNPIVPKRVTKTWMCDEIFPRIREYYQGWESLLKEDFYYPKKLYQIHASAQESNLWTSRYEACAPYLTAGLEPLGKEIHAPFGYSLVHFAGRLDTRKFCECTMDYLKNYHSVFHHVFDYAEAVRHDEYWNYGEIKATSMICCEGAAGKYNPWFYWLPFNLSSGDILELKVNGFQDHDGMYKQSKWMVPQEVGNYLAGGTFHRQDESEMRREEDAVEIIDSIKKWLNSDIEMVSHRRGIRPTVVHRRPILGEHPELKGVFVFNGLGAKGSSLCSWLAPVLADYICERKPLPAEVDVANLQTR